MSNGSMFFNTYVTRLNDAVVVDIGSQDVNGSLRQVCPSNARYIGVDFVAGKGVDMVLQDPYCLPFENESIDVVVSSSCFEHSEMFWLVFTEVLRILKPNGLFYLNVPSNGAFHRYPVDCWRFYPDSGNALVTWARHQGMKPALLESYVSHQRADIWNDFVAVFVKHETYAGDHPARILNTFTEFENGHVLGHPAALNMAQMPEDIRRSTELSRQLNEMEQREVTIRAVLANHRVLLENLRTQVQAAHEHANRREALSAEQESTTVTSGEGALAPSDPMLAERPGGVKGALGQSNPVSLPTRRTESTEQVPTADPSIGQEAVTTLRCGHCGGTRFSSRRVLPQMLIDEWQLSLPEAEYINRQQGEICVSCGANQRSIALANAICKTLKADMPLKEIPAFLSSIDLKILEINEAGTLSETLRQFPGHTFASYPEIDMHSMPYPDNSFDLVIHSDTLEHVANPVHALAECRRILKLGGALCFTVPVVVGRLTRGRDGMARSFHGNPAVNADDYLVHTEFGADVWTHVMQAGFNNVTIHEVCYPVATALVAWRT